ncbi:MAG: type I-E CRISPR-associated protein Cse2/CasB [Clostridia bacterium]|nr:type I-E CRISPR-associated protein Cse2/CasB [Clostridia bacterium]
MSVKQDIGAYMNRQIEHIFSMPDSEYRATLARLRRGIGHEPGDLPELMGYYLLSMPESLLDSHGGISKELNACYGALTLFALHQQGHPKVERMNVPDIRFGTAIARLAEKNEDLPRVQNRFNIMATSDDLPELMHHVRGIIQILSDKKIPVDYAGLAEAFYDYQFAERRASVRLKWGMDFYRASGKKEEEKE